MGKLNHLVFLSVTIYLLLSIYLYAGESKIFGSGDRKFSNLQSAVLVEKIPEEIYKRYGRKVVVYSFNLERFRNIFLVRKALNKDNKSVCYYNLENRLDFCFIDPELLDGFHYFWYLDLQKENLIYIFEFDGDEDYSDYKLACLNTKTMKHKILFNVNPVIKKKKNLYWGYPWDISDIIISRKGNEILINATIKHHIIEENTDEIPHKVLKSKLVPVMFFTGTPTQDTDMGSEVKEVNNYFLIDDLQTAAHNRK
ncbi:hypothetical protein V6Z05_14860 [Leptospira venezuelensis]|uniref:hypothetical protein n=1 Tax=Leptospira venezuelensis TaxID=1958811 RepID=UPI000A390945|nr:hypothetical protein [Leptospira venezuelensis]